MSGLVSSSAWQLHPPVVLPEEFRQAVSQCAPPGLETQQAALLLWQRGWRDPEQVAPFLRPDCYQPTSPFAFGSEMHQAIARILQAQTQGEKVTIWGDFDADGVTATAVLWEGLGQFLSPEQLSYFIPNRLTDSHGLSLHGIDDLAQMGCRLIITCDTGSTNLAEIEYAQSLGIDVIITDHHTLPPKRPPVVALLNPRSLPQDHPLAHLSGVAVAYKLIEALYLTQPERPTQPLDALLDLVAIGLIADLVQLQGDCRYLAQRGLQRLAQLSQLTPCPRPGLKQLLDLCRKTGDRPGDIAFGVGPRINAVSRIQGDARFCVELLTSRDPRRCRQLAEATELANARRKALQRDVVAQVKRQLAQRDLSTTRVIVLADSQWPVGILGLVAGQIAQEYGRPTILLQAPDDEDETALARGSARSLGSLDLYQLFQTQAHLLTSFGGHPLAAGLSLPLANLPYFDEAINRHLRQSLPDSGPISSLTADLVVTVADLGQDLFRQLRLLEPYGMGNPIPKLLLQQVWFRNIWNKNIEDYRGQKLRYIKTEFTLWDETVAVGFPGIWWGHYRDELPTGLCDVLVELDYNPIKPSEGKLGQYLVRLIAVRPTQADGFETRTIPDWIVDCRDRPDIPDPQWLPVTQCPTDWSDLQPWFRRALQAEQTLAIAYQSPDPLSPLACWQQFLGLVKYLGRTAQPFTLEQLSDKLSISPAAVRVGLAGLEPWGFRYLPAPDFPDQGQIQATEEALDLDLAQLSQAQFFAALQEEQFRQQYFVQVPLPVIQTVAAQTH